MKTPPTNQEKLDEMYEVINRISRDNAFILEELNTVKDSVAWIARRERIRFISTLLYWIFILGITFGAYYYIQPMLDGVLGSFGGEGILKALEKGIGNLNDLKNMQEIINGGASTTLE